MKRAGAAAPARVLRAPAFASVSWLQNFPERPETSIPVWRFAVGFQVLGVAHEETCFSPDDDLGPVCGGRFAGGSPWLARRLGRPFGGARDRLRAFCRGAFGGGAGRRFFLCPAHM